jgi:minor extracellular serine protease Vpr
LSVPADTTSARYEGEIILAGADAVLNIPVAVYVPNIVSGVALNPDIFSPNEDSNMDTSTISFRVQFDNDYISLDVHDALTGDWIGMINEEEEGLPPGLYTLEDWNGSVYDSDGEFMLPDGDYFIIPYVADGGDVYAIDEAAPFIIDTNVPNSALTGPIAVNGSTGTIRGQIGDDLLIDLFEDYSAIFVEARYKEKDDAEIVEGTIADDGTFEIVVPLKSGENKFEIYVYDAAGNGNIVPAHLVTYTLAPVPESGTVSIAPSKSAVNTKEGFTIDVKFAEVQELYSAQFSLTYNAKLTKGSTDLGVTMDVYQRQQMPGSSLIVKEDVSDLGNGLMRSDYVVSMAGEINGYSGAGTLAIYHFVTDHLGEYAFQLSNLRLLNSRGEEINPRTSSGATVKVIQGGGGGGGPVVYNVTGSIRAQGLGDGVDYSSIWYEGADGKLQVVVEAINGQGNVVQVGTVHEDGTYALSVPAGNYTIRVQVPGHISAYQQVVVDKHVTVHFELGHILAGDVTGDSVVDLLDLNRVARAFGKSAPWAAKAIGEADLNRDGVVNMLDVSYILGNYSTGP